MILKYMHLASKLNAETVSVLHSVAPSLLIPFNLSPFPDLPSNDSLPDSGCIFFSLATSEPQTTKCTGFVMSFISLYTNNVPQISMTLCFPTPNAFFLPV